MEDNCLQTFNLDSSSSSQLPIFLSGTSFFKLLLFIKHFKYPLWEFQVTLPGYGYSSHKNSIIPIPSSMCSIFVDK